DCGLQGTGLLPPYIPLHSMYGEEEQPVSPGHVAVRLERRQNGMNQAVNRNGGYVCNKGLAKRRGGSPAEDTMRSTKSSVPSKRTEKAPCFPGDDNRGKNK
ncbi:hypothetical protein STEG23_012879, partial [Scotinomys teguina]